MHEVVSGQIGMHALAALFAAIFGSCPSIYAYGKYSLVDFSSGYLSRYNDEKNVKQPKL